MAVMTLYKDFESGQAIIGWVCENRDGTFWFNPNVSGKRSSRKRWDTPESAIPAWARKMSDRIVEHRGMYR